ncbi:MAG: DUF4252 domain-containing protein [Bacteroidales bacterium]|jgi:hypothetical protein|nr:DUF4252 domain-containing protein [Bacteroidales bacterium]
MKKIIAIAAAMLLTLTAFAQKDGQKIYNKYSDAKGVSAVYMSPSMFRLMGSLPEMTVGEGEVNLTPIISSLSGLYIIDSENPDINADIKRDVENFVKSGKYEMLMEVKEDGEVVHMFTSGTEEIVTGFVLLTYEESSCTFICLDGQMPREQLEIMISDSQKKKEVSN